MYYSLFGIIALIILLIVNNDIFLGKPQNDIVSKNYRAFNEVLFVYFIVDSLWGMLDATYRGPLLYADTVVYHVAVALSISLWCRYVVSYLNPPKKLGKSLLWFGYAFTTFQIISIIINLFTPVFFWFDETGYYFTGTVRNIALGMQITMYSLVSILSFMFYLRKTGRSKRRYLAICCFSVVMTAGIVIQIWNAYLPLYTMGFMIGTCIMHVFVHEDEKNEIWQQLEANEKILKENTDIISNAGYGIWKISMSASGHNKMIANETLQKIFGIENMNFSPEELYSFYHKRLLEDIDAIESDDYSSMKDGKIRSRILQWNHPTKGNIYLHAGGTSYVTEKDGEVISGFCADITDSKKSRKTDPTLSSSPLLALTSS